jgi:hypothetical protein
MGFFHEFCGDFKKSTTLNLLVIFLPQRLSSVNICVLEALDGEGSGSIITCVSNKSMTYPQKTRPVRSVVKIKMQSISAISDKNLIL